MSKIQLVIEIDEEEYHEIKIDNISYNSALRGLKSIQRGTPLPKGHGVLTIPENPTNGDMVKALFGVDVVDDFNYTFGVKLNNSNYIQINKDWWNAPYNADKEVDE